MTALSASSSLTCISAACTASDPPRFNTSPTRVGAARRPPPDRHSSYASSASSASARLPSWYSRTPQVPLLVPHPAVELEQALGGEDGHREVPERPPRRLDDADDAGGGVHAILGAVRGGFHRE